MHLWLNDRSYRRGIARIIFRGEPAAASTTTGRGAAHPLPSGVRLLALTVGEERALAPLVGRRAAKGPLYGPPLTTAAYVAAARLDEIDRHLSQQEAELRLAHLFWRGIVRPCFAPEERQVCWALESTVQPQLLADVEAGAGARRWVTAPSERLAQIGGLRDDPPWIEAGLCAGIEWAGEALEKLVLEGAVTKDGAGGYWRV